MSQFDPAVFLDATLTEPTIKRPPIPVGDYQATIGEPKSRAWQGKKDPSKSGVAIDVSFDVELPPNVATSVGQNVVKISDSIMLDLTESGAIDNAPGKNRRLRQYREATNMNKPGDNFTFRAMQGRVVKVKVSHEIYEGETYERIEAVAKA